MLDYLLVILVLGFVFGVWQRMWKAFSNIDPSYPVALTPPLTESKLSFSRSALPVIERPLPVFNENALKGVMELEFINKAQALEDHLTYLGENKTHIDNALAGRIAAYNEARRYVTAQRNALRITLKHAKRLTEGLTSAVAQRRDMQLPSAIPVPPAPLYETPEQLAAKFTTITRGMALNSYKAVQQGGLAAGAAAVVASAAVAVITFSRSVRKMVESDREMKLFVQRAGDNIEILGRSYAELITTSQMIVARDQSIRALIATITADGVLSRYREGSAQPSERDAVSRLIAHSRVADAYVGMGD
jgi:hypothetical protein